MKRVNYTARIESTGETIEDTIKVYKTNKKSIEDAIRTKISRERFVPKNDVLLLEIDNDVCYNEDFIKNEYWS